MTSVGPVSEIEFKSPFGCSASFSSLSCLLLSNFPGANDTIYCGASFFGSCSSQTSELGIVELHLYCLFYSVIHRLFGMCFAYVKQCVAVARTCGYSIRICAYSTILISVSTDTCSNINFLEFSILRHRLVFYGVLR